MTRLGPDEAFRAAMQMQRNGQPAQAAHIYRQMLPHFPDDVRILTMYGTAELQQRHFDEGLDLLHRALKLAPDQPSILVNIGNGLTQQGHPDQALSYYERAIKLRPDYTDAHYNSAVALTKLDRLKEAVSRYRRAIECTPNHPGAHYNLGNILSQQGHDAEAIESFTRAIAIAPNISGGYTNRGNVFNRLGRKEEALADYRAAIAHNPQIPEAHYNCANVLRDLEQYGEALVEYGKAISLKPDYVKALGNRGMVLTTMQKPEAAMADFDVALRLSPDYPEAWVNRGNALMQLKRYEDALACFNRALAIKGDFPEGLNNRGNALRKLSRFEEALSSYERAIALHPDYPEGHGNQGTILRDLGRFDEAMASYNHALEIRPDYVNAIVNKAHLLLLTGHLDAGLKLYETRWQRDVFKKQARHYSQPAWHGETDISGKRLLIYHEQGLGDFIQCARFAPLAAARGAKVLLETPPPLMGLMRSLSENITLFPVKQDPPAFDLHIPTMSLPYAFQATEEMLGKAVPYLAADPARIEKWQAHLGQKTRPRIGITWAGNPGHQNDVRRSIAAERLKPLFDLPFDFHLLQVDLRDSDADFVTRQPNLHLHIETIEDYADTAALMQEMDQIISVDTSVVHLAGALGLPVWVMLPWVPDWRWMLEREDSPWYPTARLFRQQSAGDWDGVIERICAALLQTG